MSAGLLAGIILMLNNKRRKKKAAMLEADAEAQAELDADDGYDEKF